MSFSPRQGGERRGPQADGGGGDAGGGGGRVSGARGGGRFSARCGPIRRRGVSAAGRVGGRRRPPGFLGCRRSAAWFPPIARSLGRSPGAPAGPFPPRLSRPFRSVPSATQTWLRRGPASSSSGTWSLPAALDVRPLFWCSRAVRGRHRRRRLTRVGGGNAAPVAALAARRAAGSGRSRSRCRSALVAGRDAAFVCARFPRPPRGAGARCGMRRWLHAGERPAPRPPGPPQAPAYRAHRLRPRRPR